MSDDKNKSSLFSNDRFKGYTWLSWFKDFIIIILLMLLVFSFSNSEKVVESLGLIGTFASLALAVVAILYAFEQSRGQESNTDKINHSVYSLEKASSQIVSIVDSFEKLANKIDGGMDDIKASANDTRTAVLDLYNKINNTNSTRNDVVDMSTHKGHYSIYVMSILYTLLNVEKLYKSFNINTRSDISRIHAELMMIGVEKQSSDESPVKTTWLDGNAEGVLMGLECVGLIQFNDEFKLEITQPEKLNEMYEKGKSVPFNDTRDESLDGFIYAFNMLVENAAK